MAHPAQSSRHSPFLRFLIRVLVGNMTYPAIVIDPATTTTVTAALPVDEKSLDEKRARVENGRTALTRQGSLSKLRPHSARCNDEELKLWGLSLGMTLDLLAHMTTAANSIGTGALVPPDAVADSVAIPVLAPSLTSVLPRFSYPDVNFWIW